jgi:hypothetical protein
MASSIDEARTASDRGPGAKTRQPSVSDVRKYAQGTALGPRAGGTTTFPRGRRLGLFMSTGRGGQAARRCGRGRSIDMDGPTIVNGVEFPREESFEWR